MGRERSGVSGPLRWSCRNQHRSLSSSLRGDDDGAVEQVGLLFQLSAEQATGAAGRALGQGMRI